MSRDVFTVSLFPRPNVHRAESPLRDVLEIIGISLLAYLLIAVLVMA